MLDWSYAQRSNATPSLWAVFGFFAVRKFLCQRCLKILRMAHKSLSL